MQNPLQRLPEMPERYGNEFVLSCLIVIMASLMQRRIRGSSCKSPDFAFVYKLVRWCGWEGGTKSSRNSAAARVTKIGHRHEEGREEAEI